MIEYVFFWVGLIPIILAHTRRGRIVASCFGVVCFTLFGIYGWIIERSDQKFQTGVGVGWMPVVALGLALVSVIVTYLIEKRHETDA